MYQIAIQYGVPKKIAPSATLLRDYVKTVLRQFKVTTAEITVRIVNKEEMLQLNGRYRNKHYATNVLSFPHSLNPLMGDIAICAPVVAEETLKQHKSPNLHWAHLIVHSSLHLLGYDHIEKNEANLMETQEINILKKLGFPNPYVEKK